MHGPRMAREAWYWPSLVRIDLVVLTMIDRFSGEHAYLSNPYPTPIHYLYDWWRSTEYAFQGAKTVDLAERRQIRDTPT
jgi:hypothetical protein